MRKNFALFRSQVKNKEIRWWLLNPVTSYKNDILNLYSLSIFNCFKNSNKLQPLNALVQAQALVGRHFKKCFTYTDKSRCRTTCGRSATSRDWLLLKRHVQRQHRLLYNRHIQGQDRLLYNRHVQVAQSAVVQTCPGEAQIAL